ncbi:endonuclease VIII [Actinotignum sanguinis]|uniref:Fpg/Nei family DNA glycosylase n=1 Tax=Actinotignum sanguinis TaxID=1445614 RepID=UPI000F7E4154|nr:zinc finger domain-containing protein [Actinotignum sanguinis]MDY5148375.1 endonuclease VIII [Actinotignum sanguinis]RTE48066.1 endonuclease VIII [Actinotignum sanguinis]
MPEGHAIHRHGRILTALFGGEAVAASSPQGRFAEGAALLDGMRAGRAHAWGKHLFWPFLSAREPAAAAPGTPDVELGDPQATWLHIHLGLYGKWAFAGPGVAGLHGAGIRVSPTEDSGMRKTIDGGQDSTTRLVNAASPGGRDGLPEDNIQVLVELATTPTTRLRLAGPEAVAQLTGPARCEILSGEEVLGVIARLGPDPIRNEEGDRQRFVTGARRRKIPAGQVVMDQAVVAGPGNIYRADCLWRTGISPLRPANKVSESRYRQLWDDLVLCMGRDVDSGIIVTIPPEYQPDPIPAGDPELSRFAVYHRTGRPCVRCGAIIREELMAGRRLFWCPGCQR